jgi:hypothetical protein
MSSLTWANDPKNSRLAPASNSVSNTKVDGADSTLNFRGLNIFNTWFKYINQTWLVKAPSFDGHFLQFFSQHPTLVLRYWELFYINSLNYWNDFLQYLASIWNLVDFENYGPKFQIVGNFGETEKPFSPYLDPFSEYFLLEDFSNYFYNTVFDLYYILKYEPNLFEKSYGSSNFRNLFGDMAVTSNDEISDSNESASDSELFREKLKRYLINKKVELLDPGMKWYPILRRNPDTDTSFRSKFFHYLLTFLRNHRDLLLPKNPDELLLEKVSVRFEIEAVWAGIQNSQFSETLIQVRFNNLVSLDKSWNAKANPAFFAWSDLPSCMWSYYILKFHLESCPFILSTLDRFFMKPYFKWTQVFFFRLFEFIIDDSVFQVITRLVIIPLCLAKDEKLIIYRI